MDGIFLRRCWSKPAEYSASRPTLTVGAVVHGGLQHDLHQLVKLHPVILSAENVVFDLLSDLRFFLKPIRHFIPPQAQSRQQADLTLKSYVKNDNLNACAAIDNE